MRKTGFAARGGAMKSLYHRIIPALRLLACAAVFVAAAGCGGDEPRITQAPAQKQLAQPVEHVFVILKENHTYDNFFLSYPNPNEPNPPTQGHGSNGRLVTIVEPGNDSWNPGNNSFSVAHRDFDNGMMDG